MGRYESNWFGLYDMQGNVCEWCQDYYGPYPAFKGSTDPIQLSKQSQNYRALRGGSWDYFPWFCRAAYRGRYAPDHRHFNIGFRVCLRPD